MSEKRVRSKIALICVICVLFVLKKDIAAESFLRSAQICLKDLLPSLFPFMIAADLICRSTENAKGAAFIQLVIGWIFGFPICAKAGSQMYSDGKISRGLFRMMICCGSIPSLPFTVGVCGKMFGMKEGLVLYIVCLTSAVICIPSFDICKKDQNSQKPYKRITLSFGEELSGAISSSSYRMLSICGYVCFFSALCAVLIPSYASPLVKSALSGILEFSGGVISCRSLGKEGFILCAAILSFSGLSVYMQILSVARESGIDTRSTDYILCKVVQSSLSAITATGYVFRENALGKAILCLMLLVFVHQIFRILQLIYRKSLKKEKSSNIINITLLKSRLKDDAF